MSFRSSSSTAVAILGIELPNRVENVGWRLVAAIGQAADHRDDALVAATARDARGEIARLGREVQPRDRGLNFGDVHALRVLRAADHELILMAQGAAGYSGRRTIVSPPNASAPAIWYVSAILFQALKPG